ncbi:MAG: butyrate kinase [Candidatus Cloacimonetes bacterium]|nr:butyrate kinase [Candidatus Cloacimonadota bacterium]
MYRALAINPGSTSTKIAVFDDEQCVFEKTLRHSAGELNEFEGIIDQHEFRKNLVLDAMKENNIEPETLHAVVGRGGLVKAISGGTYVINKQMLEDLQNPELWGRIHASNLGAFIANSIAKPLNIPSFIVDPVTVDEFDEIARISGIPQIERKSLFHALNIRYIARKVAEKIGKKFDDCNMIAVHMGGGITIGAISKGRTIDVNNALLGMGPFSPQRAGALPIGDLLDMAYSDKISKDELITLLTRKGGLSAYLGTDDGVEIEQKIDNGDEKFTFIHEAMCYQICKEIGACATVLEGKVDVIFLTGGLARNPHTVKSIIKRVNFIAPIEILAGEKEMEALSQGAIRVLKGLEPAKEYV